MHATDELLAIMRRLRDPDGGCPWDLKQDFASIAPYTVEEAYEVADAIEREDWDGLRGELGDLLLSVVYHAQLAEERGLFGYADVVRAICAKMVERHPHVFGDAGARTEDEIWADWEERKRAERAARGERGVLAGVPRGLPALARAVKLQKRAARVGFDWERPEPVLDKVAEELEELRRADGTDERERELGDLLFAAVNCARHLGVRPEEALHRACRRFGARFARMEAELAAAGESPDGCSAARWEELWERAKRAEAA